MKYICPFFIFILAFTGCQESKFYYTEKGVVIELPGNKRGSPAQKLAIDFYSPQVVKIAVSISDSALNAPSVIVDETACNSVDFAIAHKKNRIELTSDSLLIAVDASSGDINFYTPDNSLILSTTGSDFIPFETEYAGNQNHIIQHFNWTYDEALFGMGQHRHGELNIRNQEIELVQENVKVSVPFLLSSKGYGLLWDNYSRTIFNDVGDSSYIWSDIGDKIQYFFIQGNTFDEIIAQNRQLTGIAPLMPRWALGYMQSRNRYRSEDELMGVVQKQRALRIPVDVIILDYYHWGDQGFGSFVFDKKDFPAPEKMIQTLHEKYHCKLLVSAWPSITPGIKNWKLFHDKGYLLDVMAAFDSQVYDAYNPQAGQLYYELLKKSYLDLGVDGWWFDATEPEDWTALIRSKCHLGPAAKYLNAYSYFSMKNVYENQIKDSSKRIFILTRSGFSGQQKFGTTVWSGDIETSFAELKKQIPAGLNLCMSGLPYWTTDIGGYKGGNPANPAYRELFIRWFQYGTFCPVFRAHGRRFPGDRTGPNEMWSYGTESQEILTDFINLRYQLLPYIYSLSAQVTFDGYTIMRGLPFDFLNDPKVYSITDQFMFGHELLVCPVTDPGAVNRIVYLPKENHWFDFWTGKRYEGGQEIMADAPVDILPLFVKAGSIIPLGPEMQYSTEKPADPIELRIYPGSDAHFILYEDENDNFNYEKGQFQTIPIHYIDNEKKVIIGQSKGSFRGCLKKRTFHVVLVGERNESGPGNRSRQSVVQYVGEEISLHLR
ncbi:MAG: glycoside hydrolase family 31 protein [Mariniphaga sp.]|nr:glycoside hydrolase family 31 protein [Mariniphaga sp.]